MTTADSDPPGGKWEIKVHKLADGDMRRLCQQHTSAFKDMITALQTLAECPNVFAVQDPLDVCQMYPDAPDHLRFKRRGGRWRCVLRIIHDGEHIPPSAASRPGANTYLQIVFVDTRTNRTYHHVRRRVKEVVYVGA